MDNYLKRFEAIDEPMVIKVVEKEFGKLNVNNIPGIEIKSYNSIEEKSIFIHGVDSYISWSKGTWYDEIECGTSIIEEAFINLVVDGLNKVC